MKAAFPVTLTSPEDLSSASETTNDDTVPTIEQPVLPELDKISVTAVDPPSLSDTTGEDSSSAPVSSEAEMIGTAHVEATAKDTIMQPEIQEERECEDILVEDTSEPEPLTSSNPKHLSDDSEVSYIQYASSVLLIDAYLCRWSSPMNSYLP